MASSPFSNVKKEVLPETIKAEKVSGMLGSVWNVRREMLLFGFSCWLGDGGLAMDPGSVRQSFPSPWVHGAYGAVFPGCSLGFHRYQVTCPIGSAAGRGWALESNWPHVPPQLRQHH